MSTAAFVPLRKQDVAALLGVSIRTVENFVAKGRMPAPAHIGARVLWHPDVFFAWLDQALRTGGWADGGDGERADEPEASVVVTGAAGARKRDKPARSRPSVSARLQARQARLLTPLMPE